MKTDVYFSPNAELFLTGNMEFNDVNEALNYHLNQTHKHNLSVWNKKGDDKLTLSLSMRMLSVFSFIIYLN